MRRAFSPGALLCGFSLLFKDAPHLIPVSFGMALFVTAVAAAIDLKTGKIPNWLTITAAVAALAVRSLLPQAVGAPEATFGALGYGLAGGLACAVLPVVLFYIGGIGGGDAKLLAALGLLLGPWSGVFAQLWAYVFAAVYAPVHLALSGKLGQMLPNTWRLLKRATMSQEARAQSPALKLTSLTFGPPIFAATALTVWWHWP